MRKLTLPRLLTLVTLMLALLPVTGGIAFFILSLFHQHAYGLLGLRPADAGIDRGRLVDDTVAGVAILFAALPLLVLASWLLTVAGGRLWSWAFRAVGRRLPISPRSPLGKRVRSPARPVPVTARKTAFGAAAVLAFGAGALFAFLWTAGGGAAAEVKRGIAYTGELWWGLHVLDFDAVPFRFTRLPPKHDFDRGCVLYLGRADGMLTLYDTREGRPLHLPEDTYRGEPLDLRTHGLPSRCHDRKADRQEIVVVATAVEDLDTGPGVLVWSERPAPGRDWLLLEQRDSRTRLLARSTGQMQPDVGRSWDGALLVTYRTCHRATCAIRQQRIPGGRSTPLTVPQRPGCSAGFPARSTHIEAVILSGARCAARDRGVWRRSRTGPWRRIATTALATGELDALGGRIAWVERRGEILRVRTLRDDQPPVTVYENTVRFVRARASLRSLRVVAGGLLWMESAPGLPTAAVLSWRDDDATCRTQWSLEDVADATRFAGGDDGTFVATRSQVRRVPATVELGAGTPLDPAPPTAVAAERCVGAG
jgi:hypothetical protein